MRESRFARAQQEPSSSGKSINCIQRTSKRNPEIQS